MNHLEDAKTIVATAMHVDPATLSQDTNAEEAAGWDSVAHINIMLALEEHIGGTIPIERVFALSSVGAIAQFLRDTSEG